MIRIEWAHKLHSVNEVFGWSSFRRTSAAKKERRMALKRMANELLKAPLPSCWAAPLVVKITRIGKRILDDDNLATACKHIRDGVAQSLGVDDGDVAAVKWEYGQEISNEYRVRVELRGQS